MDSRIYFHQYRRPRYDNPTYASSNVQNSMSFFNGSSFTDRAYAKNQYFRQQSNNNTRNQSIDASKQLEPRIPVPATDYVPKQENSRLSNYGQKSLMMDQRGVYDKQSSKFDIISLKPKQFTSKIKQYPWLTVQNRDDIYYRRMNEIYNGKGQERLKTYQRGNSVGGNQQVAGRHTYELQKKIAINPQGNYPPRKFTSKMLNHMDELQHNLA